MAIKNRSNYNWKDKGNNNPSFTKLKFGCRKPDYIVFTEHREQISCVFTGYTVEENMCSKNTSLDVMCIHKYTVK